MLKTKNLILTKYKIKKKQYTCNPRNILCNFALKSLNNYKLKENVNKALLTILQKIYKKKAFYTYNLRSYKFLSFKSKGFRMGKGKGQKKKKIYLISQGNFFLELENSKRRNIKDFKLFKTILKKKIAIKVQTFYKRSPFLVL